jgi:hypothetical protein
MPLHRASMEVLWPRASAPDGGSIAVEDWTEDPTRCAAAGVPPERIGAGMVTKPRLAQLMIDRARAPRPGVELRGFTLA